MAMTLRDRIRTYLPGYHPRYGTPLAPGKIGEPWWWVPKSNADAVRLVRSRPFLKRFGAVFGAFMVMVLVWTVINLPPPTPPIGPINDAPSKFGPISFRSPVGWTVAGGGDPSFETQPLILFAPQSDPNRAPATITFLVVDVSSRIYDLASAAPTSSVGINPRSFLDVVIGSYLPKAGRGSYCTINLTYDMPDESGLVPSAVEIVWLETRPLGYTVGPGQTVDKGPCTPAMVPSINHGPFPTIVADSPTPKAAASLISSPSASPAPLSGLSAQYDTLRSELLAKLSSGMTALTAAKTDDKALSAALKLDIGALDAFSSGLGKIALPASISVDRSVLSAAFTDMRADAVSLSTTPYKSWPAGALTKFQAEQNALLTAAAKISSDLTGIPPATGAGIPTTSFGPSPTKTVVPSPAKSAAPGESGSPSAEPSAEPSTEPTPMAAIQWFAMPSTGTFRGQDIQKILVVTLMYPADIEQSDINSLRTILDQITNSISPAV